MSITSDIRSYADNAVSEGKKVLDQAQAQLNDVTGQANDLVGKYRDNVSSVADKASGAVNDLRASAEKVINIDAIKSAIEPYLAQAKDYQANVQGRAEGIYSSLKKDKRVGKFVDAAGNVSDVVVETVQERVVKPVQSLTGLGGKPATKKPASTTAAKPAATRPAATKPAAKKTTTRPAAGRTATKRTTKA